MREIDLIPANYRAARAQSRQIKMFVGIVAAVLVVTIAARVWLAGALADAQRRVDALQTQQTLTSQERERLAAMNDQRLGYERQLQMLTGLRSGIAETKLFRLMDDALRGDELWFTNWEFRRAGVTDPEGRAVETGYFVIVENGGPPPAWQVETHMTIAGQAADHAALSEFAGRLLGRAEIDSVRIRRTEARHYATGSVVDFELAVVMNGRVLD